MVVSHIGFGEVQRGVAGFVGGGVRGVVASELDAAAHGVESAPDLLPLALIKNTLAFFVVAQAAGAGTEVGR